MTAVLARIVLRYLAGILVAYGLVSAGDVGIILDDPMLERELAAALGLLFGIVVESAYALARRLGWKT